MHGWMNDRRVWAASTTTGTPRRRGAPVASMTDTSAKARIEQLRADNARLRGENTKLRSQVAGLLQQLRSTSNTPLDG